LLVVDVSDDFDAGSRRIESFKQRFPGGRVVVLADQHELTEMVSAFELAASAYLAKVATCETFIKPLEPVTLGVTFVPPEILTLISDRKARNRSGCVADEGHANGDDNGGEEVAIVGAAVGTNKWVAPAEITNGSRLSARQRSILHCVVQGDSNKSIARKMAIAEAAVKVHVKAILRKSRVHSRTQAATWAISNGSLSPAKDELPALEGPPIEPFPNFAMAQVATAGDRTGQHHCRRANSMERATSRRPGVCVSSTKTVDLICPLL